MINFNHYEYEHNNNKIIVFSNNGFLYCGELIMVDKLYRIRLIGSKYTHPLSVINTQFYISSEKSIRIKDSFIKFKDLKIKYNVLLVDTIDKIVDIKKNPQKYI
jgi:hypothetical protein